MATWKGIVGRGFRPQDFETYVSGLVLQGWRPQFAVVHNTSEPRLSQWHSHPGEERMRNLESYYRDVQHWIAGPHLFIADDFIWAFTPLTTSGVHSPSWNAISWGIEMVGEFEEEDFDPAVRENTIDALVTLHRWAGVDPATLRFHKEDPKTTHKKCPGKNVDKAEMIRGVQERLAGTGSDEHVPSDNYLDIGARAIAATGQLTQSAAIHRLQFADIFATEFGGGSEAGMDSAYGGEVDPDQPQASLPARLEDDPRKRQIRVLNPDNDRIVVCLVNDVGPWNTKDAYWKTQTRPKAEAQFALKQKADNKQVPSNPAGLDLTPAVYDALGVSGTVNTRNAKLDWEFV
jgi:hypothetical protein